MKTPEQNVVKVCKGKKVLFLENDNCLDNGLDEFENILKRNNIEYTIIFEVGEKPLQDVKDTINTHQVIVFMTQWVYDISKILRDYIIALKKKKSVVEVYIGDPTFYYKPNVIHDVYIYHCPDWDGFDSKELEKFYKLSDEPYWDYKNKFDK